MTILEVVELIGGFIAGFAVGWLCRGDHVCQSLADKLKRALEREAMTSLEASQLRELIAEDYGECEVLRKKIGEIASKGLEENKMRQRCENSLRDEIKSLRSSLTEAKQSFDRKHNEWLSISANLANAKTQLALKDEKLKELRKPAYTFGEISEAITGRSVTIEED